MNYKYGDITFVEVSFVPLSWFATSEEAEIYRVRVVYPDGVSYNLNVVN